jgi:hypothetical protein
VRIFGILGIPIGKVHSAIASRSVEFKFRCKSCGHTEPAVVQASVKRTSTNQFRVLDLLIDQERDADDGGRALLIAAGIDHATVAQLEAQADSLALAQQRADLVSCPQCRQADVKAIARVQTLARKEAIIPTIKATILIGPMLGAMLALVVDAVATVEFPDSMITGYLSGPIILGCIALVGWVAWRLQLERLMAEIDEDLAEMQQDIVFRSRDPERYDEIVGPEPFCENLCI